MKKFFNIMILISKGICVLLCITRGIIETFNNNIDSGIAFMALGITFITFIMGEFAEKDSETIISLLKELKKENLKISKLLQNQNNNQEITTGISNEIEQSPF
ncbi:MAG: hypothetical protein DLD55_03015 [candidate division SR1 bacterium]|nr:MAG: hypothetical protein DLD55_03015 [candidate division SR1 bacterium]